MKSTDMIQLLMKEHDISKQEAKEMLQQLCTPDKICVSCGRPFDGDNWQEASCYTCSLTPAERRDHVVLKGYG
jgi:hypothetical protein